MMLTCRRPSEPMQWRFTRRSLADSSSVSMHFSCRNPGLELPRDLDLELERADSTFSVCSFCLPCTFCLPCSFSMGRCSTSGFGAGFGAGFFLAIMSFGAGIRSVLMTGRLDEAGTAVGVDGAAAPGQLWPQSSSSSARGPASSSWPGLVCASSPTKVKSQKR